MPSVKNGGRQVITDTRPTDSNQDGETLEYSRLFPILLIIFTNILGAGVILPILPLYAKGEFGGTVFQVTLLSTAYFAAQFLAAPVLGRLSDRYGRRPVLIISQIGTVAAFILFIFAGPLGRMLEGLSIPLPVTGGMFMLYAARILDGITGGNITTAQAYISDITTERQRAQGLGLLQGAFGVGFIFGPAFGGVLGNYGPVMPFIGAAIITTGTLLLTTFILKESLPPAERTSPGEREDQAKLSFSKVMGHKALATMLLISFVATLAFSAVPATFALYADEVLFPGGARTELYVGLMLTFHGMMTVVTQVGLMRPLVSRLGEQRLLLLGNVALTTAMAAIVPFENAVLVTLLFAPFAFGQGVTQPSLQSLITRFGRKQTGGQLLGLYQSSRSLALIFGPIWSGYVFDAISPRSVFLIGAGFSFLATLLAVTLLSLRIPSSAGDRTQAVLRGKGDHHA